MRPVRPLSLLTQLFGGKDRSQAVAAPFPHTPLDTGSHKPRELSILLAEDNDINALLARTVLEKSGMRVVHARSGLDAIARARDELLLARGKGFDLVLMDIHMPDMDGIEAAGGIRALYPEAARAGDGRPPIVALTADAFAQDRASYLAAGLDDYLAKPFERKELERVLARWDKSFKGSQTAKESGAA
jgi:CheY-like chemotaxis protein